MNKLDPYLPFGLTADSLLVILVACLAFITVVAVWYGLLERHPMERRAKMLAERRDQLRGQMLKDKPRKRRSESLGAMRQVVNIFKLMQSLSRATSSTTGWRRRGCARAMRSWCSCSSRW